jgi:hypothetical protein
MFKKDGNITFDIKKDGINELIDERNNSTIMLREVSWGGRENYKLELRRWIVGEDGDKPLKGVSFLTDDGPDNLVHAMAKVGFGNTTTILNILKKRENFDESLVRAIGKTKVNEARNSEIEISDEDYYDPASFIAE